MKTITTILSFALLAMSSSLSGNERFMGDTVRFRFNDFMVEVITSDLSKHTVEKANIAEKATLVQQLLAGAEVAKPNADEVICIFISEVDGEDQLPYKNISFENRKRTVKKVVFHDGEMLETDFGSYVIEYRELNFAYKFYLNELQDLNIVASEITARKIVDAALLIPLKNGHRKINGWLKESESGEFNGKFLSEASPRTNEMLMLNFGVGAGVVKNQWVNDISFRLALSFGKKGLTRNMYFAEYKMVYDFPGANSEKSFAINSFVSVGWEHNWSNIAGNESWLGASLGYCVDRNSDFFEKNTWKLAVHKRINPTIAVSPELYFNDFFKNVYPGVRVGISF